MWQPDPTWRRLPAGRGTLTSGVWLAWLDGVEWVVKRVDAPGPDQAPELSWPGHPAYWRREAEVALHLPLDTPGAGLVAPESRAVEEDADGYVVWSRHVPAEPPPGPFTAHALGRFAATTLPDEPWLSRDLLPSRVERATGRGGWPTLQRTTMADLADALWTRRGHFLGRYAALPQRPAHGDAVPANLVARSGDDVVALDWGQLGFAPAGADLGYFALSGREGFDVLLAAYLDGLAAGGLDPDPEDVAYAARVMAVYTVVSQAEWALARAAKGEGALAGKYRHPSVAPYLRALQRQLPQLERLLA